MSVSTRAAAEWIAVRARETSDCGAGAGADEKDAAAGAGAGGCCMVGPTWQWPGAAQEDACGGRGAEAWGREPSILILKNGIW